MKEPAAVRYQIKIEGTSLSEPVAAELAKALEPLLAVDRVYLVLDLSGIQEIDWYGLNAIRSAAERARGHGEVVVSGATDAVAGMFRLVRLDRKLRMFPSMDEACRTLEA